MAVRFFPGRTATGAVSPGVFSYVVGLAAGERSLEAGEVGKVDVGVVVEVALLFGQMFYNLMQ